MMHSELDQPKLTPGMTIQVSPVGTDSLDPSLGTIEEVKGDNLKLKLDLSFAMLGPKDLLLLQVDDDDRVGWARVVRADIGDDVQVVLGSIRWETNMQQRSARYPSRHRSVLTYSEHGLNPGDKETKRSLGETINVSETGVRFRVRTPLRVHTIVKMELFIDEVEPFVALGRVVRIVEGAEGKSGGFEVGVEFLRKLGGEESLYDLLKTFESEEEAA